MAKKSSWDHASSAMKATEQKCLDCGLQVSLLLGYYISSPGTRKALGTCITACLEYVGSKVTRESDLTSLNQRGKKYKKINKFSGNCFPEFSRFCNW